MERIWITKNSMNDPLLDDEYFSSEDFESIPLEYIIDSINKISKTFEVRNIEIRINIDTRDYPYSTTLYFSYERRETEEEQKIRIEREKEKAIKDKRRTEAEIATLKELIEKHGIPKE